MRSIIDIQITLQQIYPLRDAYYKQAGFRRRMGSFFSFNGYYVWQSDFVTKLNRFLDAFQDFPQNTRLNVQQLSSLMEIVFITQIEKGSASYNLRKKLRQLFPEDVKQVCKLLYKLGLPIDEKNFNAFHDKPEFFSLLSTLAHESVPLTQDQFNQLTSASPEIIHWLRECLYLWPGFKPSDLAKRPAYHESLKYAVHQLIEINNEGRLEKIHRIAQLVPQESRHPSNLSTLLTKDPRFLENAVPLLEKINNCKDDDREDIFNIMLLRHRKLNIFASAPFTRALDLALKEGEKQDIVAIFMKPKSLGISGNFFKRGSPPGGLSLKKVRDQEEEEKIFQP